MATHVAADSRDVNRNDKWFPIAIFAPNSLQLASSEGCTVEIIPVRSVLPFNTKTTLLRIIPAAAVAETEGRGMEKCAMLFYGESQQQQQCKSWEK
jgi:hypothetical protein